MSTTLQEFEATIDRYSRLDFELPRDEEGVPLSDDPTAEAIVVLGMLANQVRRIAWSGPYRAWARDVADRADAESRRLGGY